jgi:natural product precursor
MVPIVCKINLQCYLKFNLMNTNFMLQGATKLSKSEMKNVKGGVSGFTCSCHSAENDGDTIAFAFEADSVMDIVDRLNEECGDRGGTCNAA